MRTAIPSSAEAGTGCWPTATARRNWAAWAPFTSGRVVIARDGESYTVDYQFVDDNETTPHAITGTYTGPITFTNLGGGTEPDPGPGPDPQTRRGRFGGRTTEPMETRRQMVNLLNLGKQ